MKKILAVALSVLMLLPMLAGLAFADIDVPDDVEAFNVAGEANIEIVDSYNLNISVGSNVNANALIDGDRTTGTNSPLGMYYSYVLTYDDVHYFTDIVVACNGQGTLANGTKVTKDTYNVWGIVVKVYYGEEVAYESDILNVADLKEITVPVNVKGDKIEILKAEGSMSRNEYMWEIETYAPDMEICSAQVENVASEAVFSATGGNANYWWAMDYKTWVDGDPTTGSHSPKGRNYSVWMHFNKEYLFSQIDLVCNTEGGATLASGAKIEDRYFGNSMMRVLVYNYNEDLVWDSDMVDVSTSTVLSVAPYVEGAIIEIRFYNGNFGGGEYMYEVSAYAQSGEHVFEITDEENPGCLTPGFREYTCHCGKVIKQAIPATGFHKWNEGEITKVPTNTENGVLTVSCTGCDSVKLYDIASTGHNWDEGTKYVPTLCDEMGYTLYKCTDEGCDVSYKADYIEAKEHDWDNGVLTTKPTVEAEGVITYTCKVCGGEKYGRVRKHKYTDNVTNFTSSSITGYKVVVNKENSLYKESTYVGVEPSAIFDGEMGTWWYGPGGTYVEATLDREYVFTSGFFYASSNWSSVTIEFFNFNPDFNPAKAESDENPMYIKTASFGSGNINDGCDTNNPTECDMLDALGGGTKATMIRITTVGAKWENGSACKLQELQLKVHACSITEEDYILEGPDYVAPSCGTDGSCIAKCQVCGVEQEVVIEATANNSHKFTTVSPQIPATCLEDGVGYSKCDNCNETITGIVIPATGEHEYTKDVESVSPKCGFSGVGHKVCKYCDKVGSVYEIAPTGKHEYEWATKSYASYTAVGKTEYCCIYCDQLDPDTAENVEVAPKLEIPENIVEFVSVSTGNANGRNTLSFTYKIALDELPEIEKTCDVRVITTIRDAQGREATIESYGKYATNSYDAETGEFTVTIYPSAEDDTFEVTTVARLMNFRGIVYKEISAGEYSISSAK